MGLLISCLDIRYVFLSVNILVINNLFEIKNYFNNKMSSEVLTD